MDTLLLALAFVVGLATYVWLASLLGRWLKASQPPAAPPRHARVTVPQQRHGQDA